MVFKHNLKLNSLGVTHVPEPCWQQPAWIYSLQVWEPTIIYSLSFYSRLLFDKANEELLAKYWGIIS